MPEHPNPTVLKKNTATAAGFRGEWRTCADKSRAAYEESSPTFNMRFPILYSFTALFRDNHISPPSASDLAFLRRILKSEGDLKAAAERYRRAIAIAESASEADRGVVVLLKTGDGCTEGRAGEVIDGLLDGMRIDLVTIEKQLAMSHPSATPDNDDILRTKKMKIATRATHSKNWRTSADLYRAACERASPASFADGFECLYSFTSIFRDRHISPPSAADLDFMRDVLKNDAEPLLHRVQCVSSLGHLLWRIGGRSAASKRLRYTIGLAESASDADRCTMTRLSCHEQCTGVLLDDTLSTTHMILDLFTASHVTPSRADLRVPLGPFAPAIPPTYVASAKPSSIPPCTSPDRRATCVEHQRAGHIASNPVPAANGLRTVRRRARRATGRGTVLRVDRPGSLSLEILCAF
ncbi:hypothetical protein BDK51DRAFT_41644 [Blyttiomyces helicus]|uniref:Uncharacterized protein n=1 Tax=Blyttiomyces helicus TaxID=388810 RepID=A0A4P9W7M9_9FUNG|nr:hypothetical protein BDK51DRAFT_41644 [Blyttiomyces helicus]|eukprot:RKO88489.1 hypothetical protein BDK51DRAFT_41644 [Blyttiomyces helicus]